MLRKLMIGILIMSACLVAGPLWAGEQQNAGGIGKTVTAARSKKCWKRTWVTSEALMGRSTLPVCVAFEEVLNATCEPPERLMRDWTIPENEKRFRKPEWMLLDWRDYWEMVGDLSSVEQRGRDLLWKQKEVRMRKDFEESNLSLSVASIDIDNDGESETIVRLQYVGTGEFGTRPWAMFGIMNQKTKRRDWRYQQETLYVNAREGGQILLYNGKTYMFGWENAWDILMAYEGKLNICQFEYLKGVKE